MPLPHFSTQKTPARNHKLAQIGNELTKAVSDRDFEKIKHLASQGIDLMTPDDQNQTAFEQALDKNDAEMVDFLLNQGIDVHRSYRIHPISSDGNGNRVQEETLLIKAVERGNPIIVQRLIEAGSDVNKPNSHGETALSMAVNSLCNKQLVELLLKAGANVNSADKEGYTPLYDAAYSNCDQITRILLQAGAHPNSKTNYGMTPLLMALKNSNEVITRQLLKAGADVNLAGDGRFTPLMMACFRGDPDIIQLLIEAGVRINAQDEQRRTALYYAVGNIRIQATELLLKAGIDQLIQDKDGKTPFIYILEYRAKGSDHGRLIQLLLDHSEARTRGLGIFCAPPKLLTTNRLPRSPVGKLNWAILNRDVPQALKLIKDGAFRVPKSKRNQEYPPLAYAIRENLPELVAVLIEAGADVNWKHPGWSKRKKIDLLLDSFRKETSYLIMALLFDQLEISRHLIKAGIDLEDEDGIGNTALSTAAEKGYIEIIEALITRGVKVDGPRKFPSPTPLQIAVDFRQEQSVVALLKAGANPNAVDHNGDTPLIRAISARLPNYVKLLLEAGGNPNLPNEGESTPLKFASLLGNEEIVTLLLKAGGNPNYQNKQGQTPLYEASVRKFEAGVKLLLEAGGDPLIKTNNGKTILETTQELQAKNGGYEKILQLLLSRTDSE
ncbi:MAG TPA: ankyrin repeat domain-containing protein [Acidobacteriota bacterium]|nr:ankyrin repeat domain-containing protein [Acidobacteriota bacterium]HNG92124.1 ankyrin repeat domain-containing protein [Acidobacteriota bacterium]HNJ38977.1 ankyrin repeat domain-containing protein [Acidobacteriota bacterium]